MTMASRTLTILMLCALTGATAFSVAAAQEGETDDGLGALFFTDEVLARPLGNAGTKVLAMTDVAPVDAEAKHAYVAFGFFQLTYTTQFDYEVSEAMTLSGPAVATFHISCDLPTATRPGVDGQQVSSRAVLLKDGSEISSTERVDDAALCTGSSDVLTLVYELDSAGTEFDAGDTLNVQLILWAAALPDDAVDHVYILVDSTEYPSGIRGEGLPGGAGGAEPVTVEESIEGPAVDLALTFDNATTGSHTYNWTTDLESIDVAYEGHASNGTANLTILAPGGKEAVSAPLAPGERVNGTARVTADPGNWTIQLDLSAFEGELRVQLTKHVEEAHPTPDDGNATIPAGDNATAAGGNATDSPDGGALPGPAVVAVIAAVGVGSVLARKRR